MKYSGCIIEESLKDKSIINEFNIIEEINDDGIMWIVEVDESKLGDILPKIQASMVENSIWYCDLKCEDYHYIIFNDKIFKVNRDFPEQYEEVREYGLVRGIPDEQLPNKSWAK
ncbi:MAG: hypothetical protein Q4C64_08000 [Erysipelotrichia bacterium]|nr:hypothetical protein [Erysipelotrichia bacterium]